MKRLFVLFAILLLLPLPACTEGSVALSAQSPAVTNAITPSPVPEAKQPDKPSVIAVFGADNSPEFLVGVRAACAACGSKIEILPVSGNLSQLATYASTDADAAIVYLADSADQLPKASIPIYVFAAEGQSVSADVPHLTYSDDTAPQLALDYALSYPPHLAPVRMIGLFTSQSSPAYALWTSEKANGKVLAKEEFFLDTPEVSAADWLSETLPRYFPGMLDAIFAESGALAVFAADALAGLGRDDVEVFSAGTDANAAEKLSSILVCAVGINLQDAGARCFTEAAKLLTGATAESGVLPPATVWFSEKP